MMKDRPGMTDDMLVHAIVQHRSIEAFGELYVRYFRKIYRKCLSIVGNRDEAFELAEESLLKAFHSLQAFRGDSKVSTWLHTITLRHCLQHLRYKRWLTGVSAATDLRECDRGMELCRHTSAAANLPLKRSMGYLKLLFSDRRQRDPLPFG